MVAHTAMNAKSSRSHLIFSIIFGSSDPRETKESKISFIDLAGAEKIVKSEVMDQEMEECRKVNKSLSALFDVIAALAVGNEGFIPYRNNKLTMLLSDILGGNAKSVMILNLSSSSSDVEETIYSLKYATRVKKILTKTDDEEKEDLDLKNLSSEVSYLYNTLTRLEEKGMVKIEY